jgi:hypothetical protein
MNAILRTLARLGLGAALALAAGCGGENRLERVDFSYETTPPDQITVSASSIIVPTGQAIAVRAHPVMSEDELEDGDRFELRSQDQTVLGVDRGDEPYLFVIYGVTPGDTRVQAFVNGRPGPTINATVVLVP